MKRMHRIVEAAQHAELLFLHRRPSSIAGQLNPIDYVLTKSSLYFRDIHAQARIQTRTSSSELATLLSLFVGTSTKCHASRYDLIRKVSVLKDELLQNHDDTDKVNKVLEDNSKLLLHRFKDAAGVIELLIQLRSWPKLSLKVFDWRRKQEDCPITMIPEEYVKGITIAGRTKNVDLAVELFNEAANKKLKRTSTYNALMSVYMFNGLTDKCQSIFRILKEDVNCNPTIVTYNILLSVFGGLMLVDHMETTLQEIKRLKLSPNLNTYNNLITGYVIAWMWDKMEETFQLMKASPIKPEISTHLLMIRGYANSKNLRKMEETHELIKDRVSDKEIPLIISMICAYCKSSVEGRVEKIETLMRLIPEREYRPWLNVMLIKVYADENLLEGMENKIDEAFEHRTSINSVGLMKAIVANYYRCNAVDRLSNFVKRAECAGWVICRSPYHCKMVMYAAEKRLEDMEHVLDEMEKVNLRRVKKTFCILNETYSMYGKNNKADQVMGLMLKHGFGIPLDPEF